MSVKKLESILEKTANIKDIKNYEVKLDEDPLRGDGFLSESYTGSVKNKDTGEIVYTYIKKMPNNSGPFGPIAYFNEIHFYSTLWPELNKFQKEKYVKIPFTNLPTFYCGDNEPGEQYLCMENLKMQNFDLLNKSEVINADLLKLIFDKYGKFHALTFAFKDQNKEKYLELVSPIQDLYVEFADCIDFLEPLHNSFNAAYDALKELDVENAKKIESYANNLKDHYRNIKTYKGQFSALTHGDCWSNNMLVKYKENGTIGDVKFIDLQLCRDSSPIHDLSYFFYSGASKEDFKNLNEYLELYHKSFSEFAKELGSDPEKLLPLSTLKSEWKENSLLGLLMGIMVWQVKLMSKDDIEEFTIDPTRKFGDNLVPTDTFKKNTCDLLLHALEYEIL